MSENTDDVDLQSFDAAVFESTFEAMGDSPYISVTDWSAMGAMSDFDVYVSFTVTGGADE